MKMNKTVRRIIKKAAVEPLRFAARQAEAIRLRATYSFTGQLASDSIKLLITGADPAMICRLGTGELFSISHYRRVAQGKEQFRADKYDGLDKIAGFFPVNENMIRRFYERMVRDLQVVDILGSWLKEERVFRKELQTARKCPLADLEPYFHVYPWSSGLRGKKVLVVHPFEATIKRQYERRKSLFSNEEVLPEFDLVTFKAVQSLGSAHGRARFRDWFEALAWMENGIAKLDFDVALIGCGAYGLPLAAFVKRLGKRAVHLGGATQILFGIKGRRWEDIPQVARLFNKNWVRPSEEEKPDNFQEIEGGSYW